MLVDYGNWRTNPSSRRSYNNCDLFFLIIILSIRTNGDIFIFINGEKVLEMAGTTEQSYSTTISMNSFHFSFNSLYFFIILILISSYSMKVFIVSRRALPISFSISTSISSVCFVSTFIPSFSLNDTISTDGQLE